MLIIKIITELLGGYVVRKNGNCPKFEAEIIAELLTKTQKNCRIIVLNN